MVYELNESPRFNKAGIALMWSRTGCNRAVLNSCKFGNYLRIRGGSSKLNANGRTLFVNGVRRSVKALGFSR